MNICIRFGIVFTKEYWNKRANDFGHTGYSEPFLYSFDQQARLYAINHIVKSINSGKILALDFGCGSGDFVELLSGEYKTVYGFDISEAIIKKVQNKFREPNIILTDNLSAIPVENKFDIVLSVTVLQYLSKDELNETISLLSQRLSKGGLIVSMEFFTTDDFNRKDKTTKATVEDWKNILIKNNLKIRSTHYFYNPVELPTKSWLKYKNNLFLNLLRVVKWHPLTQQYFSRIAKKLINRHKDVLLETNNAYKIYCVEKVD
jgi:cyclopropane fatty-acyl-phospholipid synthase-like methyltransferase